MESSLKLEEGKFYRRRDDKVVGPSRLDAHYGTHNWIVGGLWYFSDGAHLSRGDCSLDLVEEAAEYTARESAHLRPGDDIFSPIPQNNAPFDWSTHPAARRLLSADSKERKDTPIYSGVLAYFPRAMAEIAKVSKVGNDKHNPGQPLHWSKDKSNDHADCAARHLIEHGTIDADDGCRHSAKLAWRALALLETELEAAQSSSLD